MRLQAKAKVAEHANAKEGKWRNAILFADNYEKDKGKALEAASDTDIIALFGKLPSTPGECTASVGVNAQPTETGENAKGGVTEQRNKDEDNTKKRKAVDQMELKVNAKRGKSADESEGGDKKKLSMGKRQPRVAWKAMLRIRLSQRKDIQH
ncbi:MAG: hypothetical protein SGARI_001466, partial [Bacillariaceae sp.]